MGFRKSTDTLSPRPSPSAFTSPHLTHGTCCRSPASIALAFESLLGLDVVDQLPRQSSFRVLTHQEASADLRGPWLVGRLHHEDSSLRAQRLRKGRHQELRQVLIDTGYHHRPGEAEAASGGRGRGRGGHVIHDDEARCFLCQGPKNVKTLQSHAAKFCLRLLHGALRESMRCIHTVNTHTHTRRAKVLPMD